MTVYLYTTSLLPPFHEYLQTASNWPIMSTVLPIHYLYGVLVTYNMHSFPGKTSSHNWRKDRHQMTHQTTRGGDHKDHHTGLPYLCGLADREPLPFIRLYIYEIENIKTKDRMTKSKCIDLQSQDAYFCWSVYNLLAWKDAFWSLWDPPCDFEYWKSQRCSLCCLEELLRSRGVDLLGQVKQFRNDVTIVATWKRFCRAITVFRFTNNFIDSHRPRSSGVTWNLQVLFQTAMFSFC